MSIGRDSQLREDEKIVSRREHFDSALHCRIHKKGRRTLGGSKTVSERDFDSV